MVHWRYDTELLMDDEVEYTERRGPRILALPLIISRRAKAGLENPVFKWWRDLGYEGLPRRSLIEDLPPLSAPISDEDILAASRLINGIELGLFDTDALRAGRVESRWGPASRKSSIIAGVVLSAGFAFLFGVLIYCAWLDPEGHGFTLKEAAGFTVGVAVAVLVLAVGIGPAVFLFNKYPKLFPLLFFLFPWLLYPVQNHQPWVEFLASLPHLRPMQMVILSSVVIAVGAFLVYLSACLGLAALL